MGRGGGDGGGEGGGGSFILTPALSSSCLKIKKRRALCAGNVKRSFAYQTTPTQLSDL